MTVTTNFYIYQKKENYDKFILFLSLITYREYFGMAPATMTADFCGEIDRGQLRGGDSDPSGITCAYKCSSQHLLMEIEYEKLSSSLSIYGVHVDNHCYLFVVRSRPKLTN